MSDAAPQTEQDSTVPAPGGATAAAPRPPAGGGRALPALALLLGAGGLLLGAWSLSQVRSLQHADLQQQRGLDEARAQGRELAERELLTSRQLEQLPAPAELAKRASLLGELQAGQQRLAQQVERVLGASRQEWRLAEAEHLLRLASLRLSALQDVNSARFLVSAADQILRDHDDPAAFAARQELARALEALRSLPAVDRTGLYLQLAALGEQAARLNTRAPEFVAVTGGLPAAQVAEGDGASRWAEWWQRLSGFVRLQFSASDEVKPLLAGQTLEQLRLALRLGIEQAQWAALNAQPEIYRGALEQARVVLQRYFGLDTAANQALYTRLGELAGQPVAQELPDLTPALNALQAYLGQRERAELAAEAAGKAAQNAAAGKAKAEPAADAAPAAEEAGQ